jgi:hypothetical protein
MSSTAEPAALRSALVQAVDEGLLVPGRFVRAAIYERLERSYQLRREEIPERLDTFHQALLDLLGGGGKVMEKLIAKNLYSRLGLSLVEHEKWTLLNYVDYAKKVQLSD